MHWRNLFHRRDPREEFESFLQMETEENIARGMSPDEARRAARLKFGNPAALREDVYDMHPLRALENLLRDLRYAFRVLAKSPTYTMVALLTIALGIGATTAIFTVVNNVILRPLPYPDSERLVAIWATSPLAHFDDRPSGTIGFSPGDYLDLRDQNRSFDAIGAMTVDTYTLTGSDEPDRVAGGLVSAGFFSALRVRPALGRLFGTADDSPSAERVAILSHGLWTSRFGADPSVIGKTLRLDDRAHTIIGVMPAGFRPVNRDVDLWLPVERKLPPDQMRWRFSYYMRVVARLKPGVSLEQSRQDAAHIVNEIHRRFPDDIADGATVLPLLDNTVARARTPLYLFLGAVGFVLLIACANVANLTLARGVTRHREIAVRLSLGASRAQIVRQLFAESLVLAIAGCAGGLVLAGYCVRILLHFAPSAIPRVAEIHINSTVLLFAIAAATASALIFGLWPAFAASKINPQRDLRRSTGARSTLVISEIALALMLMIGAGLLIESFHRVSSVEPGFDPSRLVSMRIALAPVRYDTIEKQVLFYRQLLEKARGLPQVAAATAVDGLPFTSNGFDNAFAIEGRPEPSKGQPLQADIRRIDPDYFAVMKIPILAGRGLQQSERTGASISTVISQGMARRYFAHESPIGQRLNIMFGPPGGLHAEIVGVAGDTHSALDGTPVDTIYLAYPQGVNVGQMDFVLRAAAGTPADSVARAMRAAAASMDRDLPVYEVHAMQELFDQSLATRRFETLVLSIFAALAGALAAIGLYGVLAYAVQSRTREIGIRTALGATHCQVSGSVLRDALKLATIGLCAGILGAIALTRLLANLLFEIRPTDPTTFTAVSVLLLVVAIGAAYLPARRAARIDPLVALRHD